MFIKSLKKFICSLFNIKSCQCEKIVDEHIKMYTEIPEPDVPMHVEKPTHCPGHVRYIKSCAACVKIKNDL